MKTRLTITAIACAAIVGGSGFATAAQTKTTGLAHTLETMPLYAGASVGRSYYDAPCIGPFGCNRRDTGLKIFGGARFHEFIGAELSYVHLGHVQLGGGGDSRAHGLNASLIAGLPIGQATLVSGKIGGTYGRTRVAGPAAFGGGRNDGFDLSYGAMGSYTLTPNIAVRFDWDRYRFNFPAGRDHVDLLSVGLQYRFR